MSQKEVGRDRSDREDFEVLVLGRVGVDLYPAVANLTLDRVDTFHRFLGGSAANVAVATARLGWRTALISRTGSDPFGVFVTRALGEFGVDAAWVGAVDGRSTTLAFCELFPPDRFPLFFHRAEKASEFEIRPDELQLEAVASARLFWTTASSLSEEPSRSTVRAALAVRAGRGLTALDLDYRPGFWASSEEAAQVTAEALSDVTVAVGNLDEVEVVTGHVDPEAGARALAELGPSIVVVKLGPRGSLALLDGEVCQCPPVTAEVVNGLGAGDAFGGALCHGLLSGWDGRRVLEFSNAAGAAVASKLACAAAMPTEDEVFALMEGAHVG